MSLKDVHITSLHKVIFMLCRVFNEADNDLTRLSCNTEKDRHGHLNLRTAGIHQYREDQIHYNARSRLSLIFHKLFEIDALKVSILPLQVFWLGYVYVELL